MTEERRIFGIYHDRLFRLLDGIKLVRQKKPKMLYDDSSVMAIASCDPSVVEQYLSQVSFAFSNKGNKSRRIYEYIRKTMHGSLAVKHQKDPLFGALIERIARMSVILDRIEKTLWDNMPQLSHDKLISKLGSPYLSYLKEYRSFIESFSNLRWAGDYAQKTKSIETIREIMREEVTDEPKPEKDNQTVS